MFLVLLRFGADRSQASALMAEHNAWIERGFDEGVFLLVGGLQPKRGGALLAHNTSRPALQQRVEADPFVAAGVVSAEILEIAPGRADERLAFLSEQRR